MRVEDNSRITLKALSNHPPQRNLTELVPDLVLDGSTADVRMAPSEPNLKDISLGCHWCRSHILVSVCKIIILAIRETITRTKIGTKLPCWLALRLVVQSRSISSGLVM